MLLLSATLRTATADDAVSAARKVFKDHQEAVVSISAVMKISGRGGSQEQKAEALATVIDKSGLTVVAYSALDPMSLFVGMGQSAGGPPGGFEPRTQFSDVKIRLSDGEEIPAKLVLKDLDLDLAFIKPEKVEDEDEREFKFIKMGEAPELEVLDELIVLGRLAENLKRKPMVALSRVSAIVNKPRKFILHSGTGVDAQGTPVFDAAGRTVGVVAVRKATSGGGMRGRARQMLKLVIIPAEDVWEVAEQALKKEVPIEGEAEAEEEQQADEEVAEKEKEAQEAITGEGE
jgi:hypothetical protein